MTRETLGPDEVHVWLVEPDVQDDAALARAEALLDAEDRARLERLHGGRQRRRFAVSHALVRAALSHYSEVEPGAWRFRRGGRGRPEVCSPPDTAGLRFNLSHTDGATACAVARELDVGVDVEAGVRVRDPLGLARRFFAEAEARELASLPPADQRERFLDYWCLKEAYLKARGLDLAPSLRQACFASESGAAGPLHFAGAPGDAPEAWQFELSTLRGGQRLAVAIRRGARADLRVRQLPWTG